jgi:hypothetical protein
VQRGVEKSVRARPAKKGRGNNIPDTQCLCNNVFVWKRRCRPFCAAVPTESSAKKWSQTRLPGTQRCMQQQGSATLFERAAQIGR